MKRTRIAGLAVGLAAVSTTAALGGCGSGQTGPAETAGDASGDVCRRVSHCRVVAQVDVDGDQRLDQVGWVPRTAESRVTIRVLTAEGERLRRTLDVSLWFDAGAWGGAARIDGRPGVELLIGTQMGAHTPVYTMLTHRHGDLVVERSPAAGDGWYVDGAWSTAVGWDRDRVDGRVLMRFTALTRRADNSFDGTSTTYAWRNGRWDRIATRDRHVANARAAAPYAGWHVRGLDQFPGLS